MTSGEPNQHMRRARPESNIFARAPSFGLRHRLTRLAWRIAWLLLARWTPPPLHRWRIFVANCFGARVHPSASLHASVRIWYPRNLEIAAQAVIGPDVDCYCMAPIAIGERAVVSQRAFLCAGTHDIRDPNFQIEARPIAIGAQSWICAESFVGPGVTVGEGAVLAARGAAFRDLEAWTVYQGNPAQPKGERRLADSTSCA